MSTGEAEFDVPNEVKDPGDLNQREQIRQLNSARSDVRDVRNKVSEAVVTGRIGLRKANTAYRQVISSYIMQLAPYLRSEKYGGDSGLWGEEDLGVVDIPAPAPDDLDVDAEYVKPERYQVPIEGVKSVLQMPSPIRLEFEVKMRDELEGSAKHTTTKRAEIDQKTLDEIVIRLDEFRLDVGLGLQLPDEIEDESDSPF